MLLWARYSFSNTLLLACRQAIIFCVHARWPFILVSHWSLHSYNILPDPELSAPPALSLPSLFFLSSGPSGFFLPPPASWPFCLTTWHSLFLLSRTSHSVLYAAGCFLSFRSELIHPLFPEDFPDHPINLELLVCENPGHLLIKLFPLIKTVSVT